jgi:FPC/CPF motif-containing protein YcgG
MTDARHSEAPLQDSLPTSDAAVQRAASIEAAFRAFVGAESFPCLAGKGVVRRHDYGFGMFGALGTAQAAGELASTLGRFVRTLSNDGVELRAFAAVFPDRAPTSELAFERRLWRQLQLLHEHDELGAAWDPTVSADPESAQFSFSFAGHALFVVGLHPSSSRLSRRFHCPALVFNPRAQFERLRAEGKFERLRDAVRERDVALQGTPNPNLADFGERSEARQYSGRTTEPEWRCPFHRTNA